MFTLFPAGDGTRTQHWFGTKIPGIFLHQVSDSVSTLRRALNTFVWPKPGTLHARQTVS
jgi:hypothetical protein